mmetsp:Transcript_25301/g.31178  ORF Transcript_25301/g.31178 Transcript_25301/m.31178 type:complete len:628 (+) Transcript_25301:211-2094(+)
MHTIPEKPKNLNFYHHRANTIGAVDSTIPEKAEDNRTVETERSVDSHSIISEFGSNRQLWEEKGKVNTPTGLNPASFSPSRKPRPVTRAQSGNMHRTISAPGSDIIAKKGFVGNERLLKGNSSGRRGRGGRRNSHGSENSEPVNKFKNFPSVISETIVTKTLEKVKECNGGLPQCVTFVLWGTDNVNTYAKTMGQVFILVGARLIDDNPDEIELLSLEELGRPRIDVVISCSGAYRDLHMNQMILMDKVMKMAAEVDEPAEMNFVRKHSLEIAESLDLPVKDAAVRVFSNSAGAYSANIASWIKSNDWKEEVQLQKQFLARKGHAFNAERPGLMEYQGELFKAALRRSDVVVQNVDLSEIISVTDVPHYYDADPTKVIQNLREDKKKPLSLWANALKNNDREVLTLAETLRLDALKKIMSPDYYEKVLEGKEGVRDISNCLRNVFGWAVTAGEVDTFVFEISFNVFIEDKKMLERLRQNDSESYQILVTTFLKASEHGYWVTIEANTSHLKRLLVAEWRSGTISGLSSMSGSRHGSSLSSSRHGNLSSSNHGPISARSTHGTSTDTSPVKSPISALQKWRRRRGTSTANDRHLSSSSHGEFSTTPVWRPAFLTNRQGPSIASKSIHG